MVLVAVACGEDAPWVTDARAPRVDAVEPAQLRVGQASQAVVYGRYLKPSYNTFKDEVVQPRAFLGPREVTVVEVDGTGTRVTVEIPGDLPEGLQHVRVDTAYGQDTLENAVLVAQ